ncbi:MAG: hypothetical protein WD176_05875, partial [Pirellulales bacterium]
VGGCALGLAAGHVVGFALPSNSAAAQRVLLMAGVRTALPMGLCVLLVAQRSLLIEQGFAYWLLVSYLVLLAADTALALPRKGP